MNKKYESYAEQVKGLNHIWIDTVKEKADALTQNMTRWNILSEEGKQKLKSKEFEKLNTTGENLDKLVREAVKRFCAEYRIKLPEDGKEHGKDIENALRVIDMLGYNMNLDNLKNILSPLRGSYRSLKTVTDVMRVKQEAALADHDSSEVINTLDEFMGINTQIREYLSLFTNVEQILDSKATYAFECTSYSNASVVTLMEQIPYSYLSCPDWMIEAGEMYAELEEQISALFTAHVPTDKELVEQLYVR